MTSVCLGLVALLGAMVGLVLFLTRGESVGDIKAAIAMLVQAGFTVEKGRRHLYRNGAGDYLILNFNGSSVYIGEESFDKGEMDRAVDRFMELTEGGN